MRASAREHLERVLAVFTIVAQQGAREVLKPGAPSAVWVPSFPEVVRVLYTCRACYGDALLLSCLATSYFAPRSGRYHRRSLLQHAASIGDRVRLQQLLKHIKGDSIIDCGDYYPPLSVATQGGFERCVEDLLAAGASPARALRHLYASASNSPSELEQERLGLRAEACEWLAVEVLLPLVGAEFSPEDGLLLGIRMRLPRIVAAYAHRAVAGLRGVELDDLMDSAFDYLEGSCTRSVRLAFTRSLPFTQGVFSRVLRLHSVWQDTDEARALLTTTLAQSAANQPLALWAAAAAGLLDEVAQRMPMVALFEEFDGYPVLYLDTPPVIIAAKLGHEAVVRHIIAHETNAQRGGDPRASLQAAVMLGLSDVVDAIIVEHYDFFVVQAAADGGNFFARAPFTFLLDTDWDSEPPPGQLSFLSYACGLGHLGVARVLLAQNANVNLLDEIGLGFLTPPISFAAGLHYFRRRLDKAEERVALLRLLLEVGAKHKGFSDGCVCGEKGGTTAPQSPGLTHLSFLSHCRLLGLADSPLLLRALRELREEVPGWKSQAESGDSEGEE